MPNYEIDATKIAAKTQKRLTEIALELVFDPVGGRLLGRAEEKLPRGEGIREVSDADYEAMLGSGRGSATSGARPLAGATRLEASTQWTLAPKSPRKASLHWVAAGGDEQALGVELGEGRGDRVEIVRPVPPGLIVKAVSLELQPVVDVSEEFALAVVLTSPSERPWLEKGPERAEPKAWTRLTFDFSDVDEGKLSRVDQVMLALHTKADEGLCLIKNLSLLG